MTRLLRALAVRRGRPRRRNPRSRRPWLSRIAVVTLAAAAALAASAGTGLATPVVGGLTARATAGSDADAWQRTGRPERLIVLRPGVVDLVSRGVVTQYLYPGPGNVTLGWLAEQAGPAWLGVDQDGIRVRSAILLAPDSSLTIGPLKGTVRFAVGDTAAAGTWIRGSRATLDIRDARLTADGGAADSPGRPYIHMGAGGRLTFSGAAVTGFGPTAGAATSRFSGVTWSKGSTGSAVDSAFKGNGTGLRLAGSTGVRLRKVDISDSLGDGLVLDGDTGTAISDLTARNSAHSGVTVSGTDNRTLTGVTTRDNRGGGIRVAAQRGVRLVGTVSENDRETGIRLVSCARCTVEKAKVTGAPVAVAVSGVAGRVTVRDAELNRGDTGVSVAADTRGTVVSGGTVTGFGRGIAIAGAGMSIEETTVSGSRTGIAVYGDARQVSLRKVTVRGGRAGVTASSTTSGVSLTGVTISGTTRKGLSSASAGLLVSGGSVSGATTAVDLGAAARLDSLTVSGARRGLHLAAGVRATANGLDVLAERKGIEADKDARMILTDSRVRAPVALAGGGSVERRAGTEVTLPPFPWLGFAALVALLLAVGLQTVHQVRHRNTPLPKVPDHVHNTA
ncbi:right-handed parallel beta-helix repeat-containing protein [Streptomyces cavernae]|uniref:right-handed parallel beta-helix repeat-containing protein n=1 Tax=Streptomyces cavernae TaxID=2259034 RepID=UPI000FEB6385|nr:right-handed parallel beta-helix repeat-containing protein [Streptomyces cavernae]